MPVEECRVNDGPGRRWGGSGTCYPCHLRPDGTWDCAEAHRLAAAQGAAAEAAGYQPRSAEEDRR